MGSHIPKGHLKKPRTRKRNRKGPATRPVPKSAFKPGDPRINRKGRPIGSGNRFSHELQVALINALNACGGENWFVELAKRDRRSFATLVGKLLPTRLGGVDGGPIPIQVMEKAKANLALLDDKEIQEFQKILNKLGLVGIGSGTVSGDTTGGTAP